MIPTSLFLFVCPLVHHPVPTPSSVRDNLQMKCEHLPPYRSPINTLDYTHPSFHPPFTLSNLPTYSVRFWGVRLIIHKATHYIDSSAQNSAEALQALGGAKIIMCTATNSKVMADCIDGKVLCKCVNENLCSVASDKEA